MPDSTEAETRDRLARAAYTLSAADARLRGRVSRDQGALSFPHARALRALAEEGPLSISRLAGHTETTGAAVTQLVNGLVKSGDVTRERVEDDRRTVLVRITASGLRRHEERERKLAAAFDETLEHFRPAQLTAAIEVMAAITAFYDKL
ncbi:DNA-binding MarR family transcriptional regulator [Amycolatopsis sulphurea]|uniref:DNA-binding MarR family transcriptional regulator n=1 Tax=Amycolatopsis sulphurea TaxID=76022 RepID=A0A2A9G2R2_9PSEU|nr:MarR family transcriptional regulator [Amycolatopsis sulphurea]PFG57226.1 DNA-binding MarR family transcriptional regulator [Amycolatopsis sulphurea]